MNGEQIKFLMAFAASSLATVLAATVTANVEMDGNQIIKTLAVVNSASAFASLLLVSEKD